MHAHGVQLTGALIVGRLDFAMANLVKPLLLYKCVIQDRLGFVSATATTVMVNSCVAPEVFADRLRTTGDLNLKNIRTGRLRLTDATVGGSVVLTGARIGIQGSSGPAIFAQRLTVDANLFMNSGDEGQFVSHGLVGLLGSRIGGQLDMSGADLRGDIEGSALVAVAADEMTVGLGFLCGPAGPYRFSARGQIRLINADIGGTLSLDGACLFGDGRRDTGRISFAGEGMRVGQSLHARAVPHAPFLASGTILLNGATIEGQLDMVGAHLMAADNIDGGFALAADRIKVGGAMLCRATNDHRFEADACIRMLDAAIGGQLSFNGACLKGNEIPENGYLALVVDGIRVGGDLVAESTDRYRVEISGQIRMQHARADGRVIFAGAELLGGRDPISGGVALNGDGMQVRGNCRFISGANAAIEIDGQVRLPSAVVGGQLVFVGAQIQGSSSDIGIVALNLDGSRIERDFVFETRGGIRSALHGQLRLQDAKVGGRIGLAGVSIAGSRAPGSEDVSIYADGITSGPIGMTSSAGDNSSVMLDPPVHFHGEVRMPGARVSHVILVKDVVLSNEGSVAFNAQGMKLDGVLNFDPSEDSAGIVDLVNATARHFEDHILSWPSKMKIRLDGFKYETLPETRKRSEGPTVGDRVSWVSSNVEKYTPGPYRQIASVYRSGGLPRDAEGIGIAQQESRFAERADNAESGVSKAGIVAWSAFLKAVVGYGYRPLLVVGWFVSLWALSTVVFATVYIGSREALGPQVDEAVFAAPWYSLDVLLPVIDLGQAVQWSIIPWNFSDSLVGWLVAGWYWMMVVAGWILVTVAIAGITGLLSRD